MKTSLVIMAAGIGSRFGGGIKQLAPVGPKGEIIMDYSVHDAIEAGFDKIIIIIRRDIEADFREAIGERLEAECKRLGVELNYAYQSLDMLPIGYTVPSGRTKPFGTGQAILSAKELISEPFAVINADDYYGKTAYKLIHEALVSNADENEYCMAGFILKNTLSDNGSVTRGLCQVENGYLTEVVETKDIVKSSQGGAEVNGKKVDENAYASMNMWGLTPMFVKRLEEGFVAFLDAMTDPLKDEYLLPIFIGELLKQNKAQVKVLPTPDTWFGVTYKEDKESVIESIRGLIGTGIYSEDLFSDLKTTNCFTV